MPVQLLAETLPEKLAKFRGVALQTKNLCEQSSAFMRANTVSANVLIDVYNRLLTAKSAAIAGVSDADVLAYFREKFGDQSAAFSAVIGMISSALDWISNNFPHTDDGYILKEKLTVSGVSIRQFTPEETDGLCDILDSLNESIT